MESDSGDIERSLQHTASLLRSTGGFVSDQLIVREVDGHFSCAVANGTPTGELLVQYDPRLSVPMHLIEWIDDSDSLIVAQLPEGLTALQRDLLDDWLILVNTTRKLPKVRSSLPRFVVNSWPLRHHLADAGHPSMRERPGLAELRRITINWHSRSSQSDGHASAAGQQHTGMGLIPLKHLVNHHPLGAVQLPVPGQVAVISRSIPGTDETFENYGDLDAMKLMLGFGFRADFAPLVNSVPVSVPSAAGQISVEWVAPRGGRIGQHRDVPQLRPDGEGLLIHDLTFRPDNRDRTTALLAMALTALGGLTTSRARGLAKDTLDRIVEANLDYYSTLDDLVVERLNQIDGVSHRVVGTAQPNPENAHTIASDLPPLPTKSERALLGDLAMVSLIQQDKIRRWWQ